MKSKTKNSESVSSNNPVIQQSNNPSRLAPQHSTTPAPRYALRKDLGFWQLWFESRPAIFKHEEGAFYVAYLLLNPPEEPIHALDLATRIDALHRKQAGLPEILDPVTGAQVALESHARLQERSLASDDAQVMRATLRTQNKLEDILQDSKIIEPVRREVERELKALYRYEEKNCLRTMDAAQKAARTVRMAINRFCDHLAEATDIEGNPHTVLRLFAAYLKNHLIVPSSRCPGGRGARTSTGLAGCFTYEPPAGVRWTQ